MAASVSGAGRNSPVSRGESSDSAGTATLMSTLREATQYLIKEAPKEIPRAISSIDEAGYKYICGVLEWSVGFLPFSAKSEKETDAKELDTFFHNIYVTISNIRWSGPDREQLVVLKSFTEAILDTVKKSDALGSHKDAKRLRDELGQINHTLSRM